MRAGRIIAALLFATCIGTLAAQQPDTLSQIPLPGDNNLRIDPSRFLKDRDLLKRLSQEGDLQKLLAGLKNPANAQSAMQDLLGKFPELRDPARLNGLKEMAERMLPNPSILKTAEAPKLLDAMREKLAGRSMTPPKLETVGGGGQQFGSRGFDRPGGSMNTQRFSTNSDLARWFQRNFGDRPEWNDMLKELNARITNADWQKSELMGRFEGELKDLGSWISRQNFELPRVRGPDIRLNMSPSVSFSLPAGPSPSLSGGGSWYGLGIVVLGGLGYLWFKFARIKPKFADKQETEAERVHSRLRSLRIDSGRDLIAVYETIALHCLGNEAMHTNHLLVDRNLKVKLPAQADSAGVLSALYEKARYASASSDLDEAEIVTARHHLQSVSGAMPA